MHYLWSISWSSISVAFSLLGINWCTHKTHLVPVWAHDVSTYGGWEAQRRSQALQTSLQVMEMWVTFTMQTTFSEAQEVNSLWSCDCLWKYWQFHLNLGIFAVSLLWNAIYWIRNSLVEISESICSSCCFIYSCCHGNSFLSLLLRCVATWSLLVS